MTYRLTSGAGGIAERCNFVRGRRHVSARELCAERLNLVEVIDLDALLCAPSSQNLCGRSCTRNRNSVMKGIHANDSLDLWQLFGVLEHGGDVIRCCIFRCLWYGGEDEVRGFDQEHG